MINEEKKFLSLGLPEKAKSKETLPAIEVANEVIWVNPNFPEMPFNLEKGKKTSLGLFLTPKPQGKRFFLEVSSLHRRSALLGHFFFEDKQGHLYRDIDLKGVGHIEFFEESKPTVEEIVFRNLKESYGILDYQEAVKVVKITEEVSQFGIRTERYISLIALKEIIDKDGNKISIEEAKKREMIDKTIRPVLAIRAFGIKNRIEEASKFEKVEDARRLVSQELGLNEKEFTLDNYLKWFAQTLGENLGKLHKNNWVHRGLSSHNITLDCRLVDFDTAEKFNFLSLDKIKNDWEAAKKALKRLQELIGVQKFSLLEEKFNQAYIKTLGYRPIVI